MSNNISPQRVCHVTYGVTSGYVITRGITGCQTTQTEWISTISPPKPPLPSILGLQPTADAMFSRNIARISQRAAPIRSAAQRRFNSAEAKPSWIVDNEFNRERAAVKHHAASTSGMLL